MGEASPLPSLRRSTARPGAHPRDTAPGAEGWLLALNLTAAAAISLLDAFTPPGIVVGTLLVIPIMVAASGDRPRDVMLVFAACAIGYGAAATVGPHTPPPPGAWLHNRILVVIVLVVASYAALLLQQRRAQAYRRRRPDQPDAAEMNRLLMSLIVHDLRSPLTTALHTIDYLEHRIPDASEDEMIGEARARLRRNLRLVDAFLAVAQTEREGAVPALRSRRLTSRQLEEVLHEEISGFRPEAATRNKQLLLYHEAGKAFDFTLDLLVMRHALTILLDNAVRYALPGPIRVSTSIDDRELAIMVEDSGPGFSTTDAERPTGTGLGLQLCSALLRRAGGELSRVRDDPDGSCFVLRLPVQPDGSGAATAPPTVTAIEAGFRIPLGKS